MQVHALLTNHKCEQLPRLVLLKASAGTGKTFCLQAVASDCAHVFKDEDSVVIVSSTATSAQQFVNIEATTAHSRWALPCEHTEPSSIRCGLDFSNSMSQTMKKRQSA